MNTRKESKQREANDGAILRYIDAFLMLHGKIQTNDVCEAFAVGRAKASKMFTVYREEKPSNMRYETTLTCYVKGVNFEPAFLSKSITPFTFLASVDVFYNRSPSTEMKAAYSGPDYFDS